MLHMKRDMDLIREILLEVEGREGGVSARNLSLCADWRVEDVLYHCVLLNEAGYLDAIISQEIGGTAGIPKSVRLNRLTWDGHEFLEVVRDRTIWEKTRNRLQDVGAGLVPELIRATAISYIKGSMGV